MKLRKPIKAYKEGKRLFLFVNDKEKYLKENSPFEEIPKLTDEKYCLHCGETIKVGDYKVELLVNECKDDEDEDEDEILELISCPNAPKCDGRIIDWVDTDWGSNR